MRRVLHNLQENRNWRRDTGSKWSWCGICLIDPLQPSGYYVYHQIHIHQFYVLLTQYIYVFCVDLRRVFFPYTTLTDWVL